MNALASTFHAESKTPYPQALTTGRPSSEVGISGEALFYRLPEGIKTALGKEKIEALCKKIGASFAFLDNTYSSQKEKNQNVSKIIGEVFVELWVSLETGFTKEQIERVVANLGKFKSPFIVPIESIPGSQNNFFLNETYGPTDAFKDLALQMLTQMVAIIVEEENKRGIDLAKENLSEHSSAYGACLAASMNTAGFSYEEAQRQYPFSQYLIDQKLDRPKLKFIVTQTSTSGDTGPAGQSGILGKNFIINVVGYPQGEATFAQRGQMQANSHTNVLAIPYKEQFSAIQDAMKLTPGGWKESLKKTIELEFADLIQKYGFEIEVDSGSFNSINPGRIDGQMNYHAYGLLQAKTSGMLDTKGEITEVVPSGNGGHVFGVLMAREMTDIRGDTVITCNSNDLFYQIIEEGKFRKPSKDSATHEPSVSMIIEYPNNMWRLFSYAFGPERANEIALDFISGKEVILSADERSILKKDLRLSVIKTTGENELREIGETFKTTGRLICPHTANAKRGIEIYRDTTQNTYTKALISETASPWKFLAAVAAGLCYEDGHFSLIELYDRLRGKEKTKEGCQELISIIQSKYEKYGYNFDITLIPENLRKTYTEGYDEPQAKSVVEFYPDTLAFLKDQVGVFKKQVLALL